MPTTTPGVISGRPGTTFRNATGRVLYQFRVAGDGATCGRCWSMDGQVAEWWPIPIHKHCRCWQDEVFPGELAPAPFINWQRKLSSLPAADRSKAVGSSLAKLVARKLITWADTVSDTGVNSLAEVVAAKHLTIKAMVKAGIPLAIATAAYEAAQKGPTQAAESKRKGILGGILDAGKGLLDKLHRVFSRATPAATPTMTDAGDGAAQAAQIAALLGSGRGQETTP